MEKTTVLVDPYREAANSAVGSNEYRGLRIHALDGLHDFVGGLARKFLKPGEELLDLAAGTGAMCLRLQDLGFRVSATDYVPENFHLDTVPFVQGDLNGSFSEAFAQRFDALVASEIIEHLENPRHFVRECFKILKPGGRMILTTPNLENPESMATFIRTGSFLWFADADYRDQGHITPLTQWQLNKIFKEVGFLPLWAGSFGEGASQVIKSPRLTFFAKMVALISSRKPEFLHEIFAIVLEKPHSAV